jgi:protein-L-isoaspartate(D-aspartate) O-methyltransferase
MRGDTGDTAMLDFAKARQAMLDGQVRVNDVDDKDLQDAILATPRELFAPKSKRAFAYSDLDLEIADGRWLIRPRDFAKLAQALEVGSTDVVLDIASGRGYAAAVLARLAETVVGLETDPALIDKAGAALSAAGVDNAAVVQGELKAGAPDQGPFDVIHVNGAVGEVPQAGFEQLSEGGRLGVVVREGPVGRATVFTKTGGVVGERVVFDSTAPLLPGTTRARAFQFD